MLYGGAAADPDCGKYAVFLLSGARNAGFHLALRPALHIFAYVRGGRVILRAADERQPEFTVLP